MTATTATPGDKPPLYFARARREIAPWLPLRIDRMLDVGCGAGATTAFVRSLRAVTWAGGVEIEAAEADKAADHLDQVWRVDIEHDRFEDNVPDESLDLVLCLDVLEHLVDPWEVVRRLSAKLAPGGRLIVSVPNIRNWKFIFGLLLRGDFHYRRSGLLDRTHLRFFVRETAIELAQVGGGRLIVAEAQPAFVAPDARWFLSRASLRRMDGLLAKQWLVVVEA